MYSLTESILTLTAYPAQGKSIRLPRVYCSIYYFDGIFAASHPPQPILISNQTHGAYLSRKIQQILHPQLAFNFRITFEIDSRANEFPKHKEDGRNV